MACRARAIKHDIILNKKGDLEMIVTVENFKGRLRQVAKVNEKSETDYNGLLYNMFGYFFDFDRYYTWGFFEGYNKDENFFKQSIFFTPCFLSKNEEKRIVRKYPDFSYTLKKMRNRTKYRVFFFLTQWLRHKEIEYLVNTPLERLVGNRNFYRLTKGKRKELFSFLKKNKQMSCLSLQMIQTAMRQKFSYHEALDYAHFKGYDRTLTISDYKYLLRINGGKRLSIWDYKVGYYKDYLSMCERVKKDIKDEYWRHPSRLSEKHDKVMRMCEDLDLRIRMRYEEQHRKENIKFLMKAKNFWNVGKRFRNLEKDFDGYEIYVPKELSDLREQAQILNQCLVANRYDEKMANGKCVLVFIKKDGMPIATAELDKDNNIVQFYADEHNRQNCHPTEETKTAMEKWRKNLILSFPMAKKSLVNRKSA